MVVKLTKSQSLFEEINKEIKSKKYKVNFVCNDGTIEKREVTYGLFDPFIKNKEVFFDLFVIDNHSVIGNYSCKIEGKKVVILNGVFSKGDYDGKFNYEYIKKLLENSKFEWEVLIL